MHNQNIKFKQAREEKLTSKYKQSRIQHQEELKRKSAILGRAFVDFQKKVAKMDLKDMESNSEIAVLRWVFTDFHRFYRVFTGLNEYFAVQRQFV